MKTQSYILILLAGFFWVLSSCESPVNDSEFQQPTDAVKCTEDFDKLNLPDFESCNCATGDTTVCGEDGRIYTSECLAECVGVKVVKEGYCDLIFRDECDPLTWEIEFVCYPIQTQFTPTLIAYLGDGTAIYKDTAGVYFRGNVNMCICLHPQTMILTYEGEKEVQSISEGEYIWTLNECEEKELQPVIWTNQVKVPASHQLLDIAFENGQHLKVSPLHPDIQGNALKDLTIGSYLNGEKVVSIEMIPANIPATWDILPAGATGAYFANGVAIGSTLKEFYHIIAPL
ncbi:MAG: hypothetical protein KDD99_25085 [Bacteroidetes bacterium]|nr:hypothetical protein [Bacteroidota bacterium]